MLKAGDDVIVTYHGQTAAGHLDYLKGGSAHVDLESRIDGFLDLFIPLKSLRPALTR